MQKFSFVIKIFKKAVFFISLVILILAVITAVSARFDIPGGFRIYSVLTGSMEPVIPVGSLIVSKIPTESRDIEKEDIITFEQPGFENKFITHRVYEVVEQGETRFFTTRGDANETFDSWLISYGRVKGIYQRHIPYLGYFLEFIRSPFGIALFVLLPVSLLAIGELKNIGSILLEMKLQKEKSLLKAQKEAKKVKKVKKQKSAKKILIIILFAFFLLRVPRTFALFSSEPVEISSISVTTGTWGNLDNVVINEVYYQGDSHSEWVELYNAGDSEVDLNGWKIGDSFSDDPLATSSLILPPDSFAVVVGSNNSALAIAPGAIKIILSTTAVGNNLNNAGDRVYIEDNNHNIIDQLSYGNNTSVWNPAIPLVAAGHSFARSLKGFDTNQASDFVDLAVPNPGTNPHPPTLEPTITPTSTPVEEAAPTATPSPEVSPTPLPKADPPLLVTLTPTAESSLTPGSSPTAEPTPVPSIVPSTTPTPSPSPEPSPTASSEPSPSPSTEPSITLTPSPSPEPSSEVSPTSELLTT